MLTNVLTLYAGENAFWESRRAAAKVRRGTLYASVSTVGTPPKLAEIVPQPFPLSDPLSTNSDLVPSPSTLRWITPLVAPYGTVREVYLSSRPLAPLVIHIQDIHGYLEAQENVAKMIQNLAEGSDLSLVGLEGAGGPFSIDDFRRYPNAEIKSKVAHFFLKKDQIGGPEYAALTSTKTLTLWGVEDMSLYRQNVDAVKASLQERTQAQSLVSQIQSVLTAQKNAAYFEDLKAFDRLSVAYENNEIGLGEYLRKLLPFSGTPAVPTQIGNFLFALSQEEALDFKAVEQDRLRLVDRLVDVLDKPAVDSLVQQSVDYRAGRLTHGQYNRFLEQLLMRQKIKLSFYPTLMRYIQYVGLADKINRNTLLQELRDLEKSTQERLAQTPDQKRVVTLNQDTHLLRQLINNQMSPEDWTSYSERRQEIHRFPQRFQNDSAIPFPENFNAFLKPFEDFCTLALARNTSLSHSLLKKMKETQTRSALLVAGGFHTEGLLQTLKSQGVSYVVVTPKIEKIDPQKNYLDVFAHDPLPLEKLFTGEPISLITERSLATGSSSPLPAQFHIQLVSQHLATENESHLAKGVSEDKMLPALNDFLSGLQTLVGERLKQLRVKIESQDKSGVRFTVSFYGKIRWFEAKPRGTRTIPSSMHKRVAGLQEILTNVRGWLSRLSKLFIPEEKMMTPEGVILSETKNTRSSNGLVIPPLPEKIHRYMDLRRPLGSYQILRTYLWGLLSGNPRELNRVVQSVKFNISHMLANGDTYSVAPLIEILGWLSSEAGSVQFLNQLNLNLRDQNASAALQAIRRESIRWIEGNQTAFDKLKDPTSMFYGPFVAVKDESVNFDSWKLKTTEHRTIWSGSLSREVTVVTDLVKGKEGNPQFVRQMRLDQRPLFLITEIGFSPNLHLLESPDGRTQRLEGRLMLRKSTIDDFVTFRWLQLMDLCVTNVELIADDHGNMSILRSLSVTQGKTRDLHSKTSEMDGLLNLAAFPTMSGIELVQHFGYNGDSGFTFDVKNFHNPRGWKIHSNDVHALFNGRFLHQWGHRATDPTSLSRALVLRMNSVPREAMKTIIEEAYIATFGKKNLSSFSTEINIFLENWDTMRKALGEYFLVPSVNRTRTVPPVAHAEALELMRGGPSIRGNLLVSPETLPDVKTSVKQNAWKVQIPTTRGRKTVHFDNSILVAFRKLGFDSQETFQTALTDYLTQQFNHSPPLDDEIVIAQLDQSTHMFEDHQGNGFVGINKQLFELESPQLTQNLFWMGLGHELAHESQGPLQGKALRKFEEIQEKKDRRFLWDRHGLLTEEERQSLAELFLPGTFKIITHLFNETQPVYQDSTGRLLNDETQIIIKKEDLSPHFLASDTAANTINAGIRELDDVFSNQVPMPVNFPDGSTGIIYFQKVYPSAKTAKTSYAINRSDLPALQKAFDLKKKEDFTASHPSSTDLVISIPGLKKIGVRTRRAVALAYFLNQRFGPLTTAMDGQKSNPITLPNGEIIQAEAKMNFATPLWTLTPTQWEQIQEFWTKKELGASGLFTWFGIRSPRLIGHMEDIGVALATIAGMNYFELAPAGDSFVALIEGMVEVTFGLGPLFFAGLLLLHFLTGIVRPDGKILKVSFSEVFNLFRMGPVFPRWVIGHHLRQSYWASRTASEGFVMLPFFGAAAVLNASFLVLIGFLLGTWRHSIGNQKIKREWEILNALNAPPPSKAGHLNRLNLTSNQSVPMVQSVKILYETQSKREALFLDQVGIPTPEGVAMDFDFDYTLRTYGVDRVPPTKVKLFQKFLDDLSEEVGPDALEFTLYARRLNLLSPHDLKKSVAMAKTDPSFRRVLSRWALAQLMLASGAKRKWFYLSPIHREAFQMEKSLVSQWGGPVDSFSRLKRAAQMAAILRAAGSSLSDPNNTGDLQENQKRDLAILLSAWGIAGNPDSELFVESYNDTLRTIAATSFWNSLLFPPSEKMDNTIYFNADALIQGGDAQDIAAQTLEMIYEKIKNSPAMNLVLVTTLPGITQNPREGRPDNEFIRIINTTLTGKGYLIWLSLNKNISILSDNTAPNLVDRETGNLRLSALRAHAQKSQHPHFEFWTHAPNQVDKDGEDIRIVDFLALGKAITKQLKKIIFFSIQA